MPLLRPGEALGASPVLVGRGGGFRASAAGAVIPDMPLQEGSWAIWSMRTVRTAYSGPLVQVVNMRTGVTLDVYDGGDGYADDAEIFAHGGGVDEVRVSVLYDQSGNGRDHAFPSTRPILIHEGGRPHVTPQGRLCPYYEPGCYGTTTGATWPGGDLSVSMLAMTLTDYNDSRDAADVNKWAVALTTATRAASDGWVFALCADAGVGAYGTTGGDLVAHASGTTAGNAGNARIAAWDGNGRGFQSLVYSCGSSAVTVDFNGEQQSLSAGVAGATAAHSYEVRTGDASSLFRGWVYEVCIANAPLTPAERADVWTSHFRALYGAGTVVLASGSSIGSGKLEAPRGFHPAIMLAAALADAPYSVAPLGRAGGWTTAEITTIAATCEAHILAKARALGQAVWLTWHEYWNTRADGAAASHQGYSDLFGAFCDSMRVLGVSRVIAYPQINHSAANNTGDNDNSTLAAFNAVIEADDWHDVFIDLSDFSVVFADPADLRFYRPNPATPTVTDGLHPNDAGYVALTIAAARAILGETAAGVTVSSASYAGSGVDVVVPSSWSLSMTAATVDVVATAATRGDNMSGCDVDFSGATEYGGVVGGYDSSTGKYDNAAGVASGVVSIGSVSVSVAPVMTGSADNTGIRVGAALHSMSGPSSLMDESAACDEDDGARVRCATVRARRGDLLLGTVFGNEIATLGWIGVAAHGGTGIIESGRELDTGSGPAWGDGYLTIAAIAPASGTAQKHLMTHAQARRAA